MIQQNPSHLDILKFMFIVLILSSSNFHAMINNSNTRKLFRPMSKCHVVEEENDWYRFVKYWSQSIQSSDQFQWESVTDNVIGELSNCQSIVYLAYYSSDSFFKRDHQLKRSKVSINIEHTIRVPVPIQLLEWYILISVNIDISFWIYHYIYIYLFIYLFIKIYNLLK